MLLLIWSQINITSANLRLTAQIPRPIKCTIIVYESIAIEISIIFKANDLKNVKNIKLFQFFVHKFILCNSYVLIIRSTMFLYISRN